MNNTDIAILSGGVIILISGGACLYKQLKYLIIKKTSEGKPLLAHI